MLFEMTPGDPMLLTTIKMHGRPEKRKEIMQTIRGLVEQVTKEKGCLEANIYQDIEDKDTLYLFEEWRTLDDLEKNKTSKTLSVLLGLESLLSESLEIKHAVKCNLVVNHEDESSNCLVREF